MYKLYNNVLNKCTYSKLASTMRSEVLSQAPIM